MAPSESATSPIRASRARSESCGPAAEGEHEERDQERLVEDSDHMGVEIAPGEREERVFVDRVRDHARAVPCDLRERDPLGREHDRGRVRQDQGQNREPAVPFEQEVADHVAVDAGQRYHGRKAEVEDEARRNPGRESEHAHDPGAVVVVDVQVPAGEPRIPRRYDRRPHDRGHETVVHELLGERGRRVDVPALEHEDEEDEEDRVPAPVFGEDVARVGPAVGEPAEQDEERGERELDGEAHRPEIPREQRKPEHRGRERDRIGVLPEEGRKRRPERELHELEHGEPGEHGQDLRLNRQAIPPRSPCG